MRALGCVEEVGIAEPVVDQMALAMCSIESTA
jgi:hypothetical protein